MTHNVYTRHNTIITHPKRLAFRSFASCLQI